jgi:hypothetical protein
MLNLISKTASSREPVTEEQVIGFLGPARDRDAERWRVLGKSRSQALPEEQILRAVGGPAISEGKSVFPTARISDRSAPAFTLDYGDGRTAWRQRGEIGTLPVMIRLLRVSVWLAAGVLMFLGMISK